MTQPRECPECGSDIFKATDYDKLLSENLEIGSRFKRLNADHALEKAQWWLSQIKLEESMKYMQQKTKKQTAALRKLEERIRVLGRRPYDRPKNAADLEPGDLILGRTVVVTKVEYALDKIVITGQVAPEEKLPPPYPDSYPGFGV